MARSATLAAAALALCLLLAPPGLAWYKPAAGHSSYSVGRAAGLLSGFRRSPYARRSQPYRGAEPPGGAGASPELQLHPRLRSLPDGRGTYQCKADVFLSLRAADCLAA
uniref:Neuropeptide B n=1 Tax=Gorilla gorilla gorilla TaxID=9595 RepID=G3RDJ3_GORGO